MVAATKLLFAEVAQALTMEKLRTLSLTNPVGIDKAPTFSWILNSDERGVMQKSYRIMVCSDSDCSNIKSNEPVVSLTLNDMAGNLVKTAGNNCDTFDISSVGKGIYLLTVETQNDTKTSKIIKK